MYMDQFNIKHIELKYKDYDNDSLKNIDNINFNLNELTNLINKLNFAKSEMEELLIDKSKNLNIVYPPKYNPSNTPINNSKEFIFLSKNNLGDNIFFFT